MTTPLEVVQSIYAAFGHGDLPALLNALAEDIEWTFPGPRETPFAGVKKGRAQVQEFFAQVMASADIVEFQPLQFIAQGENVVVLGREKVKVKATGKTFETRWAHAYTVKNGKVATLQEHTDTAALATAFRK